MYHKWTKPTSSQYQATLLKIKQKNELESEMDLFCFIKEHMHLSDRVTERIIADNFDISKLKYANWVFMNLLAGNDVSKIFEVKQRLSIPNIIAAKCLIGADAFKTTYDGFHVYCNSKVLFQSKITSMTARDFTNSISADYTVFNRKFIKGEFPYVQFKLYLLKVGFPLDLIGIR
ncbi:hypothetical protein [Photobacterium leiognathi]|uniref:hypothetical protein n=1 Tax=Photobacterium leiognathi TaxID=553611 RepID=UPI0029817E28|nr:hypothetical protein [Photobacterium leiognathi]